MNHLSSAWIWLVSGLSQPSQIVLFFYLSLCLSYSCCWSWCCDSQMRFQKNFFHASYGIKWARHWVVCIEPEEKEVNKFDMIVWRVRIWPNVNKKRHIVEIKCGIKTGWCGDAATADLKLNTKQLTNAINAIKIKRMR